MKTKFVLALCAAASLGVSSHALASGAIISPVGATIDASGPGFGDIADTYNQNGLSSNFVSGVTNFDSYIATNPTHTIIFPGFEWFGNSGTTTAQVTYDLGSVMTIDRLALWNEESSGIGHLNLIGDSGGFLSVDPFDTPYGDYPAQVFSFAPVTTQFVTFSMSNCPQADPGTFDACAIGEVAFRTADGGGDGIPEPASWALMIVGFGLAGASVRSRRQRLA